MFVNGSPWDQQHSFNTTQSGDIGAWVGDISIPGARAHHSTVFIRDYVWLIGGKSSATEYGQNSYRGTVDSSGVITSWTTISNFPFNRAYTSAVVIGGYVYIPGGYDTGINVNTILRATIDSYGVVGTFSVYPVTFSPYGRSGHRCAVIKDKLYIFGGNGSYSDNILVSTIADDGSLGTFSVAGTLTAYVDSSIAITSDKVYIIGGFSGVTWQTAIQAASINLDGTLGPFSVERNLTSAIAQASAVVSHNNVHVIGGKSANSAYRSAVTRFPITDGSITGQSNTANPLGAARYGHSSVITSSRVYVLGGINALSVFQPITEVASYSGGANNYSSYLEEDDPINYMYGVVEQEASGISGASTYPSVLSSTINKESPDVYGYLVSGVVSGKVEQEIPESSGLCSVPILFYGDIHAEPADSSGVGSSHLNISGSANQEEPESFCVYYYPWEATMFGGDIIAEPPEQSAFLQWDTLLFGAVEIEVPDSSGAIDYPLVLIGSHYHPLPYSTGLFYAGEEVFSGVVVKELPVVAGSLVLDTVLLGAADQSCPTSEGTLGIHAVLYGATDQPNADIYGAAYISVMILGAGTQPESAVVGAGYFHTGIFCEATQEPPSATGAMEPYNLEDVDLSFSRCLGGLTPSIDSANITSLHYLRCISGDSADTDSEVVTPLSFSRCS